jgi:hypothetical protein
MFSDIKFFPTEIFTRTSCSTAVESEFRAAMFVWLIDMDGKIDFRDQESGGLLMRKSDRGSDYGWHHRCAARSWQIEAQPDQPHTTKVMTEIVAVAPNIAT